MMATMLDNGEMKLTDEECDKLKLPPNTVIPPESVAEIQGELQDIADDEIRKLARQIGLKPEQEPYPGYFEDIERLGLTEKNMVASSANPAGMYGPDGKVRCSNLRAVALTCRMRIVAKAMATARPRLGRC